MAHYAFLDDNNIVTEVIVGRDEDDLAEGVTSWEEYYGAFRGQKCLRTSYNTRAGKHIGDGEPFRKNFAGIGFTYDEARDAFIPPQPFESWTLNNQSCVYEPPVSMPDDGQFHMWDEAAGAWVEVQEG